MYLILFAAVTVLEQKSYFLQTDFLHFSPLPVSEV